MTTPVSAARRRILMGALAGAGAMSILPSAGAAVPSGEGPSRLNGPTGATLPTGDIHDFDFFVGNWTSVNRRLKKRWVGSDDWDVFPNTIRCENRMGGVVNIDEVVYPTKGWSGMTVRTFNIAKRQWSLYWINSQTGELFPPVVGGFAGDHGEFHGDDMDEGRPIKVVFHWTRFGPDAARWQQAFSLDGKKEVGDELDRRPHPREVNRPGIRKRDGSPGPAHTGLRGFGGTRAGGSKTW